MSMNNILTTAADLQSRRSFLLNSGMGLGAAAFASLVPRAGVAAQLGMHHNA